MEQNILITELLTKLLNIPDSWIIFDVTTEDNELFIHLKEKEILIDNAKTETLRHLDFCAQRTYIKFYFLNDEALHKLSLYTKTGFCKPFIEDVMRMFDTATDKGICNTYGLTTKELNTIKEEYNTAV